MNSTKKRKVVWISKWKKAILRHSECKTKQMAVAAQIISLFTHYRIGLKIQLILRPEFSKPEESAKMHTRLHMIDNRWE